MKKESTVFTIIILTINICFSHECYLDSMQHEIKNDFKRIDITDSSLINSIDFILPKCEAIETSNISKYGNSYQNPYRSPWFETYLKHFSKPNVVYLVNQVNGDDWIVGWQKDRKVYIQFIDGRTMTVLIKFNGDDTIDITDHIDFKTIYKKLNGYIDLNDLYIDGCSTIDIQYKNSRYFEGFFTNLYLNFNKLKKDYIWSNGRYVVLDIIKLKKPYKDMKRLSNEYYDYRRIIDGIPKNDNRSFTRFRMKNNIDLNQEMHNTFPWMKDSIKHFESHPDSKLYGKTPVYIIESDKESDSILMQQLKNAIEADTCNNFLKINPSQKP